MLALLLGPNAPAQMQPRARFEGELLPIVLRKEASVVVLKNGKKHFADYGEVDIQPASSFGPGFVNVTNVMADLDPLKNSDPKERAKPHSIKFRYEADIAADTDLDDCCALLTFVVSGSIGTYLLPVGSLKADRAKHLKAELEGKVDEVGLLHVFSQTKEIKSTQVPKAYDVHEYFASLRARSKGVPALDLCKSGQIFPAMLSNDGRLLATTRDRDTHYSVIVYDLASMQVLCDVPVGKYYETVREIKWISPNEVAFLSGSNLMLLNIEKKSCEKIRDQVGDILGALRDRPEILVILNYSYNYYVAPWTEKFDVHSRTAKKLDDLDSGYNFFSDTGDQRLLLNYSGDQKVYSYKPTPNAGWVDLDKGVKQTGLKFNIKGSELLDRVADIHSIGPDGDILYISTRLDSDVFQIAAFSMKEGVIKRTIAKHPKYDLTTSDFGISRLLFRKASAELIGIIYEAEKPRVVWLDQSFANVQKAIDNAFPERVNLPVDWSQDGSTFIYFSTSDQDPGTYYVFRPLESKLIPILVLGDRLKGRTLARTTPFDFTARDGATVHAYVTYPAEPSSNPPPLVVNIHGGPAARDVWGFDTTNQFLATRGYAVLQVNYRGSSGYGAKYQRAGLQARLDTVVIDDVADGVEHLIKQGTVDPSRIAVMGASFGGWATYLSLVKYPNLYRAGVAIAAISHWNDFQKDHGSAWDRTLSYTYWKSLLGGSSFKTDEQFIDPLLRASEIKQPIYIMHGDRDRIVSPEQAELMLKALQKHNEQIRYMRFPTSSHSDWPLEDRVTQLNEVDVFLRQYLQPLDAPKS